MPHTDRNFDMVPYLCPSQHHTNGTIHQQQQANRNSKCEHGYSEMASMKWKKSPNFHFEQEIEYIVWITHTHTHTMRFQSNLFKSKDWWWSGCVKNNVSNISNTIFVLWLVLVQHNNALFIFWVSSQCCFSSPLSHTNVVCILLH